MNEQLPLLEEHLEEIVSATSEELPDCHSLLEERKQDVERQQPHISQADEELEREQPRIRRPNGISASLPDVSSFKSCGNKSKQNKRGLWKAFLKQFKGFITYVREHKYELLCRVVSYIYGAAVLVVAFYM
jgi:hypothetical protein